MTIFLTASVGWNTRAARLWLGVGLPVVLAALSGCGSDACVEPECPVSTLELKVLAPDGSPLNGVQASLSGNNSVALTCTSDSGGATCTVNGGFDRSAQYSLHVTADGFEPLDKNVSIESSPPADCSCPATVLNPANVTLTRAP